MVNPKIIRVPEKKYIQALIVGRINAALVVDDLTTHHVPIPTNDMKAIYDEVLSANPKYLKTQDEPEQEWLESLGIAPMYYYRFQKATELSIQGCSGAFRMLDDPKIVKFINILALSGIPKDDIELILNARYDISYDTPDFNVFMNYFSNYDGWSRDDKELYINAIQDPDLKKQYKNALVIPRSQLIWELGLGTDPDASFDDMLKDMFTDSYFLFKKNLKFKPDDSQKFAQLAVKLADRMSAIEDNKKDQTDIFAEMKFKLINEDTQKKSSNVVKDIADMDVEIPVRTDNAIKNLDLIMNEGVQKNVFSEE